MIFAIYAAQTTEPLQKQQYLQFLQHLSLMLHTYWSVILYNLEPFSINGLFNTKIIFQFEPVVSEISAFKQTKSSAL